MYQVSRETFREEHVALGLFRGDAFSCYGNRTLFPLQPSSALKPRRGLESRKKLQKDVTVGLKSKILPLQLLNTVDRSL